MKLVFLFALIYGFGSVIGMRRNFLHGVILCLWSGVFVLGLASPAQALRISGWDWRSMLAATLLLVVAYGYFRLVSRMRRKGGAEGLRQEADLLRHQGRVLQARSEAQKAAASLSRLTADTDEDRFEDNELDRYLRHILLREIGGSGQRALREAKVLVVGAGGLGAPVCLYLAGAGVGHLTIADDDRVELSNLHRQVIFSTDDAASAKMKAQAAMAHMAALNPNCRLSTHLQRIGARDADFVSQFDLVIDGTDSHASRAAINLACVEAGVPLLAGSIAQWDGQVTVYDPARDAPCMACLFPDEPPSAVARDCAAGGVAGPLPGIIGTMMAMEAVKMLTGAGQDLRGRLLIWGALAAEARVIRIGRNVDCGVCGNGRHK